MNSIGHGHGADKGERFHNPRQHGQLDLVHGIIHGLQFGQILDVIRIGRMTKLYHEE